MIIICNGAIKSGSTWLYNILVNLVDCQDPPQQYLTGRTERSPCIRPASLAEFLRSEPLDTVNYISKNHLNTEEQMLLLKNCSEAFVFDITRDPKDVVVSNYYHDCFRNGYEGSFKQYYWRRGRYVAADLAQYHQLWQIDHPRFYTSSYEQLHADFDSEVSRIAAVLGIRMSPVDIEAVKDKTTLSSLRKEYKDSERYKGDKFFRKGQVGDWRNHFDDRMLNDVNRIESAGLGRFDRLALAKRFRGIFGCAG